MLSGYQFREEALPLLFAAPAAKLVDAQVRMRTVRKAYRRGRAADFLHRDHVCEVAERRPAILFFDRDTEQAQFAEFRPEITRKPVAFVDLRRPRCNAIGRERGNGLAQQVDILAEAEVKIEHLGNSLVESIACTSLRESAAELNTMLAVGRYRASMSREKSSYCDVMPSLANKLRL